MSVLYRVSVLALLAFPTAAAVAADVPGGPGTGAALVLGQRVENDFGSPADTDWFRASLTAGKLYAVRLDAFNAADVRVAVRGADGGVLRSANLNLVSDPYFGSQQLNFRPEASGTYFISFGVGTPAPGDQLPPFPTGFDITLLQDNSSGFTDAVPLASGREFSGRLESDLDEDFFVVRLTQGQPIDLFSPVDFRGAAILYDRDRQPVGAVDWEIGRLSFFQPAYTGNYFIKIRDIGGGYTLRVARADRGRGDDTLYGGPGNDRLSAGNGFDKVQGEGGDDVLTSGLRLDFMWGQEGNDRYAFFGDAERGYDAGVGGGFDRGQDYIGDFNRGDKIDLRGVDADATRAGR